MKKENQPRQEHIDQLQFYLNSLNIQHGQINYLDKSALLRGPDQVDLTFNITQDSDRFIEILNKATHLAKAISFKEQPKAEPCWLCEYCMHNERCSD